MGTGVEEFFRKIGGYLATALVLSVCVGVILFGWNTYKSHNQAKAEKAFDNIVIQEMSKDVQKVKSKVIKETKKEKKTQYTTVVGPHEVEIIDMDGRKHVGMTIKSEEYSFTTTEQKPNIKYKTKALGLYRSIHVEGIGLSAGLIHIPLVSDMKVETGLLIGRDVKDGSTQGGFLMLLSKPIVDDDISVAIGATVGVKYGSELIGGVRYEF